MTQQHEWFGIPDEDTDTEDEVSKFVHIRPPRGPDVEIKVGDWVVCETPGREESVGVVVDIWRSVQSRQVVSYIVKSGDYAAGWPPDDIHLCPEGGVITPRRADLIDRNLAYAFGEGRPIPWPLVATYAADKAREAANVQR